MMLTVTSDSLRFGPPATVRDVGKHPVDRAELRSRVQAALASFLDRQRTRLAAIDPTLLDVADAIDVLVLGSGKRLRPAFAYWGYRGAGGADSDDVLTALSALELVQASALTHDDVMDASDTRRGEPSVHRRFEQRHRDEGWIGPAHQFGESAAILIGDLCLVWSDELFEGAGLDPRAVSRARPVFDEMRTEVMVGQYLDVLTQATGELSVERASKVARFKSAKYTVERPLLMGGALADAPPRLLSAYSDYGLALGEAFQLRDDILGVFGDPAETGKPAGDDLREGKRTYLVASAFETASPADAQTLHDDLGDPKLGFERIERLRQIIVSTGALDRTEARIETLANQAHAALAAAPVTETAAEALRELIEAATQRRH
jgi:geranylgeranyl diphosphate synthase, type I